MSAPTIDPSPVDAGVVLPVQCATCGRIFEWAVGIEPPSPDCPACRGEPADTEDD